MKAKTKKLILKKNDKKTSTKPLKKQTVEEHREAVLEQGRKFKYPIQYSKHKILINALIVGGVAIGLFVLFSWWMLYQNQTLSDFYYTATRVIPIPVAFVDGEPVRYGDYMRRMRASIYYLEKQENRDFNNENGEIELNYTRRFNMDESLRVAFATKIAREYDLIVTDSEIDANIEQTLIGDNGVKISQKAYETSLWRYYGWSIDDYREIVRQALLMRKASFVIDDVAKKKINNIKSRIDGGADFAELAKTESDDEVSRAKGGDVGSLNITDFDSDGLVAAALKLEVGGVSAPIQGVDAWYVIKLTEKTNQTVRFSLIRVSLTEFDKQLEQLRTDGKIVECIEIKKD